jgi:hypothetical protein
MEATRTKFAPRVVIALSTILLAAVMLICIPQGQAQAVESADSGAAQAALQEFTGTFAAADDSAAVTEADAKQASGKKSKYGLLAKNGKLYPCNKKGKKLGKYWKVGSTVKVIYVAANAKKVPALSNVKYYYKARYSVVNAIKNKVTTVKFLTKKGKSKVKTIKANAFKATPRLKSVKNLNKTKVTSIGNDAFYKTKIKSIKFPKTLKSIGSYAFAGCENIASISLPASCTKIDSYAFAGCTKMTKLYMPSKAKVSVGYNFIAQSGIDRGYAGAAIYVPAALYNAYYNDTGTEWPYYNKYLVKQG